VKRLSQTVKVFKLIQDRTGNLRYVHENEFGRVDNVIQDENESLVSVGSD
jgi:hypothetical protein